MIDVIIEGAKDSEAEYNESDFLRFDSALATAIWNLYESGATIENIAATIANALDECDAGV